MEEKNCTMRPDTPLKAIACFDAVMRTGSAKLAAQSLFVTPGAVGQQLRKLEDWLGVQLFVRSVRKLHPTEEALRYWRQIKPALAQIDDTHSSLLGKFAFEVSLSLPPAFASTWFARRMPDLMESLPDLRLHLNANAGAVDFRTDSYDLAVRHFDGDDKTLHSRLLLPDEARVFCSPHYRDRMQIHALEDLSRATFIHTTSHANWSRWLAHSGASVDCKAGGLRFDQSELAIDAARRGQGLVLTSPWLIEEDLEQQRLVQLFDCSLPVGKGYYVVYGVDRALNDGAKALSDWLFDAADQPEKPG
jgi:LysR family transcriptional regulator, glycine cleavage system transcriptional activator